MATPRLSSNLGSIIELSDLSTPRVRTMSLKVDRSDNEDAPPMVHIALFTYRMVLDTNHGSSASMIIVFYLYGSHEALTLK